MTNQNKGKIKPSTIIRLIVLAIALINQCLAMFGKGLPFTENLIYQILSVIATIVVAIWTAWKNNDITYLARKAGQVFQALKDGVITDEEANDLIASSDAAMIAEDDDSDEEVE